MQAVFDSWLGGLSVFSDNIGTEGMYAEARDVDCQRSPGYIMPGFKEQVVTQPTLEGLITDAEVDPDDTLGMIYAINSTAIYKIKTAGTIFTTTDSGWPHHLPLENGKELIFYDIGSTSSSSTYLFSINATTIGRCDTSTPTFIDDYLTGSLSANPLQDAPHPAMEWGGSMFVPNGRFLSKLDGSTGEGVSGDTGTWTEDALTFPADWEITSLFPTENYIGICAWKKLVAQYKTRYKTESAVFFWNGNDDFYNWKIPVEDNKIVSSFNDGTNIYILTEGRGYGTTLRKLSGTKAVPVKNFKFKIEGTDRNFYTDYPNVMDVFQNRLLIGLTCPSFRTDVFAYGTTSPLYPEGLFQVSSVVGTAAAETISSRDGIGFLKHLYQQQFYLSFYNDSNYYWKKFSTSVSGHSYVKPNYREMDRKVQINYVKFYFKPLVSGDSIAVSIDTDKGTSNSLGKITYAGDGAITSKRFDKRIECESFRPVIGWSAGGTEVSKVVVDYTPKSDR